ncbi:hypothetical protein VMCG_00086 [Cytospora schulzeri]|uniref:Calponin-homology (CH) domain-containing protein n=1 Tax=Cytospora schulzeri TaxID=448051 RepID=A0A423XA21_9PEZI|nr:hypothetical protein VMCG_00086 [Valsa malicola]
MNGLDRDLRRMRLEKYTPAAANEARSWIESVLGEPLPAGDLLVALKDGVALCKLVNLALPPPGVKFKKSAMPFVQMENISHFLRSCKSPPYNLQEHDVFLTVDLFESKDPAQVLQCLGAFSRAANKANPTAFPSFIGPRAAGLTPQKTGAGGSLSPTPTYTPGGRPRGMSNSSSTSSNLGVRAPLVASKTGDSVTSRWSPAVSPSQYGAKSPSVSSWSSRANEGNTSPAWNIAQYGYMGGASQANLGISFGGRRQITNAGPAVPSLAEKEKRRKEVDEKKQRDEEESRRKATTDAEKEKRWEEESRRLREEEKLKAEEEKRRWEEEERQWRITEEKRRREEEAAEARLAEERAKARRKSGDSRLQGQFLSQYQAEQTSGGNGGHNDYSDRIRELERELELARQREAQYERERQDRLQMDLGDAKSRARSRSRPRPATGTPSRQDSWARGDEPAAVAATTKFATAPRSYRGGLGATEERDAEDRRRAQAQQGTKAGGWASKSLLEREMEMERQRQREWEESQKETASAPRAGNGIDGIGGGIGGRWDVGQWAGFTGGDNQNRGGQGIGAGRRQIVGPRPLPSTPGSGR